MPELIAFFHSFVGLVATLVGFRNFRYMINASILVICFTSIVCYTVDMVFTLELVQLSLKAVLNGLLDVHLIMAIGEADMQVVISMHNSYSGWATAESGLMLRNLSLLCSGAFIGSSAVIQGNFGGGECAAPAVAVEGELKSITSRDAAKAIADAKSIIKVPRYEKDARKAQYAAAAIIKLLRKHRCNFRVVVHQVARSLPRLMNVILAVARAPYDIMLEMDKINKDFLVADVSVVLIVNDK
ncbi:MAG: putative pyridine nucleotide transhydrogenase [Streblomastix strix]|uniref:proton-translocating NAD(P)(+) transhydrogenase n=1 Tax=Streblomastix strix TaxID=222440 RepID=A0A5J4VE90_9EUKA|nr:MAG: putative pyridine nucleotide transhydrogenase [Streblomastix strix]